ncbi:MAG TPA: DinB family protein, partial [Gemmatimonadales bacterium]|nr:DinB family protein [Gemmatimonadales bacterium]
RLRYQDAPFAEVLEELTVMRRRSLRLLRTLTPAELGKAGQHVERGRETLAHLLKLYAGHDLVHRRQLDRILAGT